MLQNTNIIDNNRADFHRNDFEKLIAQKGRAVTIEQAIQCSCKSKATNQQSNCQNCSGTGWVFINPRSSRLVIQQMKMSVAFASQSENVLGDINITGSDTEELAFMDRITMLDGKAIFNEVLFFKVRNGITFSFSAYNIKQIIYIAAFQGVNVPLLRLVQNVDYTYDKNIIKIINPNILSVQGDISVSIRYVHAPTYLMVDMKRESMESFEMIEREGLISLPISGTARRAHYILGAPSLSGSTVINNSYL